MAIGAALVDTDCRVSDLLHTFSKGRNLFLLYLHSQSRGWRKEGAMERQRDGKVDCYNCSGQVKGEREEGLRDYDGETDRPKDIRVEGPETL